MFEGEKVILRPRKSADKEFILKWFNDPEVTRYVIMELPVTEKKLDKWLEQWDNEENTIFFVIVDKETKNPIGTCGFVDVDFKNQNAEMGMIIGEKEYWGKGRGTEVTELLLKYGFGTLNFIVLYGKAVDANLGSIKMQKNFGFKEQGRLRKWVYIDGKFHDVLFFDLLREEWKKQPKDTN